MVGNRLKLLRDELGLNQDGLAKKIGVSPSAVGMYERDLREANDEIKLKMCKLFNCSMDYLTGNSDIRKPTSNLSAGDFKNIPVIGKIAAGQPILAEENIEGYLPVDPNIYGLSSTEDLFYLLVAGQSMNMKVKNGDYALIHKQDYAEDGDIVVAIVNGDNEATLKRYKKLNDQFVLLEPMSTDPSIEAITVDLKNTNFKIIGKAIGQFGKF